MRIFDFTHYKRYIKRRLEQLPGKGRGELTKIARHLGVHTTMMSHVLKGDAHLSLEQALKLADYLGFTELETDYLVALVQWERAGDSRARAFCERKVTELREKAQSLKNRLDVKNELTDADRAHFYSSWMYASLRLLTAIERFQSFDALVRETGLPAPSVRRVLDFLISRGLCREEGSRIVYAAKATYVDANSPLVTRHHLNWRQQTQARFEKLRAEDLVFTYPTAISEKDFLAIREKLVQFIEEFKKTTEPSPSENLYCLNFDWIKLSRD